MKLRQFIGMVTLTIFPTILIWVAIAGIPDRLLIFFDVLVTFLQWPAVILVANFSTWSSAFVLSSGLLFIGVVYARKK